MEPSNLACFSTFYEFIKNDFQKIYIHIKKILDISGIYKDRTLIK